MNLSRKSLDKKRRDLLTDLNACGCHKTEVLMLDEVRTILIKSTLPKSYELVIADFRKAEKLLDYVEASIHTIPSNIFSRFIQRVKFTLGR